MPVLRLAKGRLQKLGLYLSRRSIEPILVQRDKADPLVLMSLEQYAELLSYKRQAKSWAELSAEEQAALTQASEAAQDKS